MYIYNICNDADDGNDNRDYHDAVICSDMYVCIDVCIDVCWG